MERIRAKYLVISVSALLLGTLMVSVATAAEETISKKLWLDRVESGLVQAMCYSKSYFTSCFPSVPLECKSRVQRDFKKCTEKLSDLLPPTTSSDAERTLLGSRLGECVGRQYETENAKRKVRSANCSDSAAPTEHNPDSKIFLEQKM